MPEMLKLTKSLSVVPATNTRAIFFSNKIHQNLFQKHHIVSCTLMENRPAQYGKSGYRNQGLQLYYKRGFWYSCFPVNFSIFLRTPFYGTPLAPMELLLTTLTYLFSGIEFVFLTWPVTGQWKVWYIYCYISS